MANRGNGSGCVDGGREDITDVMQKAKRRAALAKTVVNSRTLIRCTQGCRIRMRVSCMKQDNPLKANHAEGEAGYPRPQSLDSIDSWVFYGFYL